MKKLILRILAGLLALAIVVGAWAYMTFYPRHYSPNEFENLPAIAEAADNLRAAGLRGRAPRDYLPAAIWDLDPKEVRVYPTGVLILMKGFFTYESGIYIPTEKVAANIEALALPTYRVLGSRVYSYKVEG